MFLSLQLSQRPNNLFTWREQFHGDVTSPTTLNLPWVFKQRTPYFFLHLNQISNLSTDFSYNFPMSNFRIIRPVREALEYVDTRRDGRINGYDVRNGRFLLPWEDALRNERVGKAAERKCEKNKCEEWEEKLSLCLITSWWRVWKWR